MDTSVRPHDQARPDSPAGGVLTVRYARWDGVGQPCTVVTTTTPAVPGPGEVLVRVDLATVCGSDVHTVTGRRPGPAPGVLGHEQVGTVLAVGPGPAPRSPRGQVVTVGTRVVWSVTVSCGHCDRCTHDLPQKCRRLRKHGHEPLDEAAPLDGGFATHCVLRAGTTVMPVPDAVPDVVASPAACATATVAAVLRAGGRPLAGARVLVSGAGMLGLTAVAMAARAGADVTAVDPDPGRRARATRFGARQVFDPAGIGAAPEVDLAVELSGAASAVGASLASLAVGGTLVLAGSVSPGPSVALDPERLVRNLNTVVGVHNYRPADLQAAVDFLAEHHRAHPFAELVAGRFTLDQLDEAFAAAGRGTAPRVAVVPGL